MGQPDFGRLAVHPIPLVAHVLHHDDADVVDVDVPEAIHNRLPDDVVAEPELAVPLWCRWRLPLTRVHNPSDVLLYQDQLYAQTLDQVMTYVKVNGSIVI